MYVFRVISLQVRQSIAKPHSTLSLCCIFALGLAERRIMRYCLPSSDLSDQSDPSEHHSNR